MTEPNDPMPQPPTGPDTLDALSGVASWAPAADATGPAGDTPLRRLRQRRGKVATATEACQALFFGAGGAAAGPAGAHGEGVGLPERLLLAVDTAQRMGLEPAAEVYARLQAAQPAVAEGPRRAALLHFARTLADHPAQADRLALQALAAVGLGAADTVLLAQLIGYLAYQLRLAAGLAALQAAGEAADPGAVAPPAGGVGADDAPFVHPAMLPPPGQPLSLNGFTSATLDWRAWLPVVDPAAASAEQLAVLDASHPKARSSDFYLLLAHQPRVLAERSQAFNAIMYAPGGLGRAERELATTAVSVVNRCVYCASVHAQRYEQLARRQAVIAQLFTDVDTAGTTPRERAIVRAAVALTRAPVRFGPDQIQALRAAGLSDLEVLDTLHATALFAWANRLMLNLGEPVQPA